MTAYVVAVSAGHHPEAKGASYEGKSEFDFTVPWQAELIKQLGEAQTQPHLYLVPKFVPWGTLQKKVAAINAMKADIAIEVHFNAGAITSGCETLYAPGSKNGVLLASKLQKAICQAMGVRSRGVKEGWYKMDRPGVVNFPGDVDGDEKPDYFLARTRPTAIILEPEFISQQETIDSKMVAACQAMTGVIMSLAETKHFEYNLPPTIHREEGRDYGEG